MTVLFDYWMNTYGHDLQWPPHSYCLKSDKILAFPGGGLLLLAPLSKTSSATWLAALITAAVQGKKTTVTTSIRPRIFWSSRQNASFEPAWVPAVRGDTYQQGNRLWRNTRALSIKVNACQFYSYFTSSSLTLPLCLLCLVHQWPCFFICSVEFLQFFHLFQGIATRKNNASSLIGFFWAVSCLDFCGKKSLKGNWSLDCGISIASIISI